MRHRIGKVEKMILRYGRGATFLRSEIIYQLTEKGMNKRVAGATVSRALRKLVDNGHLLKLSFAVRDTGITNTIYADPALYDGVDLVTDKYGIYLVKQPATLGDVCGFNVVFHPCKEIVTIAQGNDAGEWLRKYSPLFVGPTT